MRTPGSARRQAARAFLGSPRFAQAVALCAVGSAVFAPILRLLIGWPGLIAILSALSVLTIAALAASERIEWRFWMIPTSLLVFLGWSAATIFWSQYQWVTLGGLAYLGAFTILGLGMAMLRDSIQIVRVFGSVLRVALGVSLGLEIFAGVLIDTPLPFLRIAGSLDQWGPIQGVMGDSTRLGVLALIGAVTFATELRTRSVSRPTGIASLVLAAFIIALTQTSLVLPTAAVLAVAVAALFSVRRIPAAQRTWAQLAMLAVLGIGVGIAWSFRQQIISLVGAESAVDSRLELWRSVWSLIGIQPLEGWGWAGIWRPTTPPFTAFSAGSTSPQSALNAYLDVWLQVGLVGLVIFVGLVALAFVRSWLLAGSRRSIVYAWPALVLVVLIVSSLFESSILIEYGWLTFVVCCVRAAEELSWRKALAAVADPSPEFED